MPWKAYRLQLRLLSPLHIGQAKVGNLQITRSYLHGKALWGALTARITRDTTSAHPDDYRHIGQKVHDQLAFSYFYPTTQDDVSLWPWDNPERFAWMFLNAYASTSLNYSRNSAEDGSLHETEFIAPFTRDGKPVYLMGYVFEKEGCKLPWQEAFARLQLGGERTYGWGRITVEAFPVSQQVRLFGQHVVTLDGTQPHLHLEKGDVLLAHTRAHGDGAVAAIGRVVPLVGRETSKAGEHGRCVNMVGVYWEPGSRLDASTELAIGKDGLWHAA